MNVNKQLRIKAPTILPALIEAAPALADKGALKTATQPARK